MTKWVQQRVPRTVRVEPLALSGGEVEGSSCSILQQGWLWGPLTAVPPVPAGRLWRRWSQALHSCAWREEDGHNLRQEMFRLHMRSDVSTMKTVQQWDRQPRKALKSPSLETQLDIALCNHVCSDLGPQRWLCWEQELDKRTLHKK